MLCVLVAKTGLHYYIKKIMEEAKEEESKSKEKEVVSPMHDIVCIFSDYSYVPILLSFISVIGRILLLYYHHHHHYYYYYYYYYYYHFIYLFFQ